MSTGRIPPVLRAQAGGAKTVDLAGATAVGERDEVVILPTMAGGAG